MNANEQQEQLLQQLRGLLGQAQAAAAAGQQPAVGFAPVVAPAMFPAGMPANGFAQAGGAPQPNGISITLQLQVAPGVEMPVQLHFGPEWAANVQGFVQMVGQVYGQVLKTYQQRNGGFGGGYGGGFGGGNRFGGWSGRGGRRW